MTAEQDRPADPTEPTTTTEDGATEAEPTAPETAAPETTATVSERAATEPAAPDGAASPPGTQERPAPDWALAVAAGQSVPEPPPATPLLTVEASPATIPAPDAVAEAPKLSRWARANKASVVLVRPMLMVALFVVGIAAGVTTFRMAADRTIAVAPTIAPEPSTMAETPVGVVSLVAALNADNQTQIRAIVPPGPYRVLAGELAARDIKSITAAQALRTYVSGPYSATEVLVLGHQTDGSDTLLNLVIHMKDGEIVELR